VSLIPVVLEFSNVINQYSLCVCLCTPGVSWALADGDVDDQGLSYNALVLGDSRSSCVQRIQLRKSPRGSVLEVAVNPTRGTDSFTLTCYLDAPSDLRSIDGYCSLNSEARISARFGDAEAIEWRDGDFLAELYALPTEAERMILTCSGILGGESVRVNLSADSKAADARWVFLNVGSEIDSLSISSKTEQTIPLSSISISMNQIELITSSGVTSRDGCDFVVEAYLAIDASTPVATNELGRARLNTDYEGGGTITAKVGKRLPRYLTKLDSAFDLS
jgi:hypothetical protein